MRILKFDELKSRKGIPYSRVHIGRLEAQGNFPSRVHLGPGRVGWVESEIDSWLAERVARRDAIPPTTNGEAPADADRAAEGELRIREGG